MKSLLLSQIGRPIFSYQHQLFPILTFSIIFGLQAGICSAQDIVDVLSKNCFSCHGPSVKQPMGGLSMATGETIKKGGGRGPAVIPGRASDSLMLKAVTRTAEPHMPPGGLIPDKDVEIIRQWIDAGAIWLKKSEIAHWAYRRVVKPDVPQVKHPELVYNPIDAFIVAEYEKKGLKPVALTDQTALLRRITFDLIGLPPTPEELDLFLNDSSPQAYEKIVDRLLGNEQHGVNYARHWLDVLRYADVDEKMPAESGIYRWRDWVIHSLNGDLPYDQFVKAQLVGDLLDDPAALFAIGFLARGADSVKDEKRSIAFAAVETATTAFLGSTVGCAKCHDHMFDPIRQADYYGLKAIFDPLVLEKRIMASAEEQALHKLALENYEHRKAELEKPLNQFLAPFKEKLQGERIRELPPVVQEAVRTPEEKRTPEQKKLAEDYAPILRIDPPKYKEIMTPEQIRIYDGLRAPLAALTKPAELETFWTVREDQERTKQKSVILESGDPDRPTKEEVKPSFRIADDGFEVLPTGCKSKPFTVGGRQKFVEWMLKPENPLFARVAVNRLWQWHFGVGLVKTPSDFGALSELPSHPELLDWLAVKFVESGYSMKAMHRLIVTSRTYQLASAANPANEAIDPNNVALWRMPLRRLAAEEIRDAILWVSGKLDLKLGGKSFTDLPTQRRLGSNEIIGNLDRETNRRGVYMARGYHSDAEVMPNFLHLFDVDNGKLPNPSRTQTITALQALTLMNSPLLEQAAADFGSRLAKEAKEDPEKAVELGYRIALGRLPSASEKQQALSYMESCEACKEFRLRTEKLAWVLLNLDEFVFVR